VNPILAPLAWRALPVILVLAWFLALIGGFSLGGLLHLLLVAAAGVFAYQLMSGSSA
jgi:hypothetical protein